MKPTVVRYMFDKVEVTVKRDYDGSPYLGFYFSPRRLYVYSNVDNDIDMIDSFFMLSVPKVKNRKEARIYWRQLLAKANNELAPQQ